MVFERAWIINEADEPFARDRLTGIVAHLTRQKWRQLVLENSCAGLFWGLTVSTAAVVAMKLVAPGLAHTTVVALIVAVALAAALAKTWIDRPDRQRVAILADIELRLKQRLSTAWEFAQHDEQPELSQYLAVQAVNRRYPSRHNRVFPARATVWVRLMPLAALLLLLVSVLDLPTLQGPSVPLVDDVVVTEGGRLREFARQMQVRAERGRLPRSSGESELIRRLGARMQSGSISRGQALQRLQNLTKALAGQRRAALADAGGAATTPAGGPANTGAGNNNTHLRELLERMLQGELTPAEMESATREAASLSAAGITPDALREALENLRAGRPDNLREMVEELSRIELAAEDAEELRRAGKRIAQVRENLGDLSGLDEASRHAGGGDGLTADEDPQGSEYWLQQDEGEDGPGGMGAQGIGSQPGSRQRQRAQNLDPRSARDEIALRPHSRLRDGSGFTTEARILPRPGRPSVAVEEIDPRFAAQVEAVFARDQYPLHHKEFIRRYFLRLTQGVAGEARADAQ